MLAEAFQTVGEQGGKLRTNKGEIVAILGPNGAGKSTAIKAMLGLLNLKSGNVLIEGEDIS